LTIKTQSRLTIFVSICLVFIVGGILFYANRKIDSEVEKNFLADRISKNVFDLQVLTSSYLLYREDRQKQQWALNLASLKKMLKEAKPAEGKGDENLEIIAQRCDEMEALFGKIISYVDRMDNLRTEERVPIREVYYRLITNLAAKGQEMVSLAFLLIQESNRDLASMKRNLIVLVMIAILLAIVVSGITSYLLNVRMVTSIRQLQKGMKKVAEGDLSLTLDIQSDDEISLLAQAFDEMTGQLNEAEKERTEFIKQLAQSNRDLTEFAFIASHDLQEPLRKIQAFGDRLKARHGSVLNEEARDYLERMQNAANRMQTLIRDLLNYSRVTSRPEPFSRVPLTALAKEVVSDLSARIEQTGGRVEVGDLPVIQASPLQMRQLLQNLLSNALKFHGEKKPRITLSGTRITAPTSPGKDSDEPWVELRVEDNGVGFDEKYLDRIFIPFQRLHGRSQYEGTGMGLAICRKIVERHSGTITARSAPGRGTTFIILLPEKQKTGESPGLSG
jgi:signal transduction histidine kinase